MINIRAKIDEKIKKYKLQEKLEKYMDIVADKADKAIQDLRDHNNRR